MAPVAEYYNEASHQRMFNLTSEYEAFLYSHNVSISTANIPVVFPGQANMTDPVFGTNTTTSFSRASLSGLTRCSCQFDNCEYLRKEPQEITRIAKILWSSLSVWMDGALS